MADDEIGRGCGRPTKYSTDYVEQAEKLCKLGATDRELANFFNADITTFYDWRHAHPDFAKAVKIGKEEADNRVERSLYHKANGYTFESVKIFQHDGVPVIVPYTEHIPPDTTACIFWLKNRRPAEWRDVQVKKHEGLSGERSAREELESRIARLNVEGGPGESPKRTNGKAVH